MGQEKFYNIQAYKFLEHKSKYGKVDHIGLKFIDSLIQKWEGKKILDYGCGNGANAIKHLQLGADFILGVDVAKGLIENALQDTINLKNIEFLSIDTENKAFDFIIPNNSFDHIVSYYVLCTIQEKKLIELIIKSIFDKLKGGGSFITLLPNRDRFNGKVCYGFSYIKKDPLREGDEVITYLRTNDSELPTIDNDNFQHLRITDYYWSQETFVKICNNTGFTTKIHELFAPSGSYSGIVDEENYSPIYVLEAVKK